jgi:hypothetical protein
LNGGTGRASRCALMAGVTSIVEVNRTQHTYLDIGLIPHGSV